MILEAKDLSPNQKAVIEDLLGRRVLQTETISVRTIDAPTLNDAKRDALANELRSYFAEVDARREQSTEVDEEQILNEAIRSVRPRYRPHK